jgi:hypothetical protein
MNLSPFTTTKPGIQIKHQIIGFSLSAPQKQKSVVTHMFPYQPQVFSIKNNKVHKCLACAILLCGGGCAGYVVLVAQDMWGRRE